MSYYKATIEVLIDVDDEGSACDAISEAIRPMLREFCNEETAWVDWRYAPSGDPAPHDGEGFEYAEDEKKESDNDFRAIRECNPIDYHQTKVARSTLNMPDALLGVMGGPSKKEAREYLRRKTK